MTATDARTSENSEQGSPTPGAAEDLREVVHAAARNARAAGKTLTLASTEERNAVLIAAADALEAAEAGVLAANADDIEEQRSEGAPEAMLDRLRLTADRIVGIAGGLRQVAGLPDPLGQVVRGSKLPNGMKLEQIGRAHV